jgi:hypothetical protein
LPESTKVSELVKNLNSLLDGDFDKFEEKDQRILKKAQEAATEVIETYGELYPYFDNYEILTDINEEIYNNLLPQLSKQVKDYKPLSF